jgi:hypothetical protein
MTLYILGISNTLIKTAHSKPTGITPRQPYITIRKLNSPVPVAAQAHRSFPMRAMGTQRAWIGVGLTYPSDVTAYNKKYNIKTSIETSIKIFILN